MMVIRDDDGNLGIYIMDYSIATNIDICESYYQVSLIINASIDAIETFSAF